MAAVRGNPLNIAYTPRAKKVIELSMDEARKLGHTYVGTEHILLGLIREGEGVAGPRPEQPGCEPEQSAPAGVATLGKQRNASPTHSSTHHQVNTPTLDGLARDLTAGCA